MEHLPDEEILRRSQRDPTQFAHLMARYEEPFLRKAYSVVRNHEEAEDIVQETFTKMYLYAKRYKKQEGATFKSWAYRILMNTAFTHYQKIKRVGPRTEYMDAVEYGGAGPVLRAEEIGDASDARRVVAETIRKMPEHLGKLLALYYLEDKSYQEIAERESIPLSTLKMRLFRAKRLFKKMNDAY
jgi:RNA polymerase sigma-70 factor (ECF subfamily)